MSAAVTTASSSTSHISEILRLIESVDLLVGAADDGVGLDTDPRSAATECWVGLVFASPDGSM